jgi:polyhydroxybutyrate depolymerase
MTAGLNLKQAFFVFVFLLMSCNVHNNQVPVNSIDKYHGMQRDYVLHLPPNLPPDAPLVFVLHGYGGLAYNEPTWNSVADSLGFAVVAPQGENDKSGKSHWNAGFPDDSTDDIGFLSELAVSLQAQYHLNPAKTFSCGYSNGGFMSYYLISKRPDVFKAAASISGTMSRSNWQNRNTIQPAPILQISGALDDVVPVDGSMDTTGGWGGAPAMNVVIDFWAKLNQCASSDTVQINKHTVAYTYTNGINGNEVWYYLIDNLEHYPPPIGINGDINSAALIGEFFKKH